MPEGLKFGTSGVRGLAEELLGPASTRYAAAFLDWLTERAIAVAGRPVLVGQDLRASSPAIARLVMGAIAARGADPLDCGELPTPALALAAMARGVPAIMVTGSHIPADRNGLKFYTALGEIDKADEAGINARLAALGALDAPPSDGRPLPEALAEYRTRYLGLFPADALAGMRVGVFQHSSVARDLLVSVLAEMGAEVIPLGRAAGFVAIDTEAISPEIAAACREWAGEHRLDAMVSTDGDADRPLVVDETGAILRGDVVGVLTARVLRADAVVTPVTSNSAIEETGLFVETVRTKVGSPYVIAGMGEAVRRGRRRVVGFEANGGVLLGSAADLGGRALAPLPTRDAFLPVLAILFAARREAMRLSELVATVPARTALSGRLEHVPAEDTAAFMTVLRAPARAAEFFAELGPVADVSEIDGLRFILSSGEVVHFRPSGNAPELRCYVEAGSPERAEALLGWGLAAAEKAVR